MGFRLEFRDIEYINAIDKNQSFTKAAESLHITQPALSIYINKLEERLGVKLFSRIGKRLVLTYAGMCLLEDGKQILLLKNSIQVRMDEIRDKDRGVIRIGFTPVRGILFYPLITSNYRNLYPNMEIVGIEAPARELEKMVLDGAVDIAFYNYNTFMKDPRLEYDLIISDSVVLFISEELSENYRVEKKEGFAHPWIDLRLLADVPFIRNHPEQNTEQITLRILEDYQLRPPVAVRISSQLTALNLVAYNCGVYLAPEYFFYNTSFRVCPRVLSIGETPTKYNLDFAAVTVKGAYQSRPMQELIKMSKSVYTYTEFAHTTSAGQ